METSNSDPKGAVLISKNHRWGLGPVESSHSGPNVAVLDEKPQKRAGTHRDWYSNSNHFVFHAQNDSWGLGSIETCNSDPKVAVLQCKNHRWVLGPIETSYSDAKGTVLNEQNPRWTLGPIYKRHSVHDALNSQVNRRSLGPIETCSSDPKVTFCVQKPGMRAGTNRDLQFWC